MSDLRRKAESSTHMDTATGAGSPRTAASWGWEKGPGQEPAQGAGGRTCRHGTGAPCSWGLESPPRRLQQ